jgi:signal transduction histidine kinase
VRVAVEGTSGGPVEIDGNAVRRCLLNLVRNAGEAGATSIVVRVEREPGAVEFEVADDGPGMAADVAARIFDPFYTTRARGSGLGLAVTRQVLEDLGGSIVCDTEPGRGTTFRMRVPC